MFFKFLLLSGWSNVRPILKVVIWTRAAIEIQQMTLEKGSKEWSYVPVKLSKKMSHIKKKFYKKIKYFPRKYILCNILFNFSSPCKIIYK